MTSCSVAVAPGISRTIVPLRMTRMRSATSTTS